jgi:hypothetical protein
MKRIAVLSNETRKRNGVAFGHICVMVVISASENPGFIEQREDCFYRMHSGGLEILVCV